MSTHFSRRNAFGLLLAGAGASLVARQAAAALPALTDRPILTISGKVREFNDGAFARFDRAGLESLGMSSFSTATPWFPGVVRFEGVPMTKLLQAVGAHGESLQVTALNDYATEIPVEDITKHNPLLALKRDGEYMNVREKGPLFIVFPYDSNPELKNQRFYSRSPWSVARIAVR